MIVSSADFEAPFSERGAQCAEVGAGRKIRPSVRRRRSRGAQLCSPIDRAVAVGASDFDGGPHFAVEFRIAVIVLIEVAVDAVHPLFQVDVHQVHRHALALLAVLALLIGRRAHGLHQILGRDVGDDLSPVVQQIARAVFFEHRAENPAVAVEVGELRMTAPRDSSRRREPETRGRTTVPARPSRPGWTFAIGPPLRRSDTFAGQDTSTRRRFRCPTT